MKVTLEVGESFTFHTVSGDPVEIRFAGINTEGFTRALTNLKPDTTYTVMTADGVEHEDTAIRD